MTVQAKICGISTADAARAAVAGGAALVGFVFYPPSPRAVTPEQARSLAGEVPPGVLKVGLFVDPDDAQLERTLAMAPLDLLQLHGAETPARAAEIRARTGVAVMKAIKVEARADIDGAREYEDAAERLLFDAKAPKSMADALPGGNGLIFDWNLLKGRQWRRPWMLSGGLTADNVAQAVSISGAPAVDVSSGVEDRPGHKDPAAIARFLAATAAL